MHQQWRPKTTIGLFLAYPPVIKLSTQSCISTKLRKRNYPKFKFCLDRPSKRRSFGWLRKESQNPKWYVRKPKINYMVSIYRSQGKKKNLCRGKANAFLSLQFLAGLKVHTGQCRGESSLAAISSFYTVLTVCRFQKDSTTFMKTWGAYFTISALGQTLPISYLWTLLSLPLHSGACKGACLPIHSYSPLKCHWYSNLVEPSEL